MIDKKQNSVIAKAIGVERKPDEDYPDCYLFGGTVYPLDEWPEFTTCLDAMYEAEKVLTRSQRFGFIQELTEITSFQEAAETTEEIDWCFTHATAAQRAEAFLRTIGKLKD